MPHNVAPLIRNTAPAQAPQLVGFGVVLAEMAQAPNGAGAPYSGHRNADSIERPIRIVDIDAHAVGMTCGSFTTPGWRPGLRMSASLGGQPLLSRFDANASPACGRPPETVFFGTRKESSARVGQEVPAPTAAS
jgi:hypothetical protein